MHCHLNKQPNDHINSIAKPRHIDCFIYIKKYQFDHINLHLEDPTKII